MARITRQRPKNGRRRVCLLSRVIDDFSHEARTPLAVIGEYLSWLRDERNEEERREIVDVLTERVGDLHRAFNDFVDFLKLDAGTFVVSRRRCAVADLIALVRTGLDRKAAGKNCTLTFDSPTDRPDVYCDKEQIGRVIVNLALSAMDDSGPGRSVHVGVACHEQRKEVCIIVAPEGPTQPTAALGSSRCRKHGAPDLMPSRKGIGRKSTVIRDILRRNLSGLKSKPTNSGIRRWFGLPMMDPAEIVSRYLTHVSKRSPRNSVVSILRVNCIETIAPHLQRDIESFLAAYSPTRDLILPVDLGYWLIARRRKRAEREGIAQRIEQLRQAVNRKRPWGPLPSLEVELLAVWRPLDGIEPTMEAIQTAMALRQVDSRQAACPPRLPPTSD